ncbi:hypothetical protein PIB30_104957 [Stylosanthes scabra]|uniref:Uncharacterized protein n=1 Tax=Stylosanthes scabra TaxID=79078 RepID=A0ABU6X1J5_9FABA|nr:hypothetical protein [Stylosanthes scabra]
MARVEPQRSVRAMDSKEKKEYARQDDVAEPSSHGGLGIGGSELLRHQFATHHRGNILISRQVLVVLLCSQGISIFLSLPPPQLSALYRRGHIDRGILLHAAHPHIFSIVHNSSLLPP